MPNVIWVLVAMVSLQATTPLSVAQADPVTPVVTGSANAVAPAAPRNETELQSPFLRAEVSLWDTFGVKLSKNGQQVGPTFFSVVPDEAVAGSAEAKQHAGHARVFQGVVLGLATAGLGLLVGSLAVRSSNDNRWTDTSGWMLTGGVFAEFAGYFCATMRQNEILAAVDAYNHDLVSGRLRD